MTEAAARAREAIDQRRAEWIAAINRGDADGFVAALTDDAVWLPWGREAIAGRERIHEWLTVPLSKYDYEYEVLDIRVRLAGDWAVERARFRTRALEREGGEAPLHEGTHTLLWRRSARGWYIERYIDHTGDTRI